MHLLNEILPISILGLVRGFKSRLYFRLDLLPQRRNELDIHIRFEESSGDFLQSCIENLQENKRIKYGDERCSCD